MYDSIKNYIFDFGNVLVRYDPLHMTLPHIQDPAMAAHISQIVFDRLYWDPLDCGSITDDELKAACRARLPETLHSLSDAVYDSWFEHLPFIEGMAELVLDIKKKGGRLFLLSNVSIGFAEGYGRVAAFRELFSHFDGLVFSGPLGLIKPDPAIFHHLLSKFDLDPRQCLFIDDNAANTAGAESVGIMAYHFDGDAGKLRKAIGL